jgi:hypothetical protein
VKKIYISPSIVQINSKPAKRKSRIIYSNFSCVRVSKVYARQALGSLYIRRKNFFGDVHIDEMSQNMRRQRQREEENQA